MTARSACAKWGRLAVLWFVLGLAVGVEPAGAQAVPAPDVRPLRVAAKPFTESYLLAELLAQAIEAVGEAPVERKFGIGGPQLHAIFEWLSQRLMHNGLVHSVEDKH